jgi:hypothetical protein
MTIKALFPTVLPTLNLDFANTKVLDPRITFTRASTGTFVGGNGLIQTAASGVPRFDHNPTTGESLGLLVEEARTNSIRNNTMVGAVPGTPGTGPTNWSLGASTDLTRTIVGTGIENGINYIDVRYTGTVTAARVQYIFLESSNNIAAVNGQSWTGSVWLKIAAGSLSNISSLSIQADTRDSSLVYVNTPYAVNVTPTTTFTRFSGTGTATGTTAWILPFIVFNTATSGLVDITLRIGLPQLEQGAFATSVIPTTSATATRAADVASITGTNFSSWYRQDEGSFFCSTFAPKGIVVFGTGDTFDNTQYLTAAASNNVSIRSGGLDQAVLTAPVSSSANTNIAFGYALNSFAAVSNGGTISTDTSGAVPLAQVRLKLGSSAWETSGSNNINGTIRRLVYFPIRLANITLQAITAS